MNKDRELREVLFAFYKERKKFDTIGDKTYDVALQTYEIPISQIKALYKPLKIEKLNPVSWYRNDWEKVLWNKVNEVIAIINARGER